VIMPRTTESDRIASLMDIRDMLLAYHHEGETLEGVIARYDRAIARRLKREKEAPQ
jgi:hypothetical protein